MSSFRDALKEVKAGIRVNKSVKVVHTKVAKPKQYLNGYELSWEDQVGSEVKIPTIRTNEIFVQYPTDNKDIKLPVGTVRASYNKESSQVEFFGKGSDKPIYVQRDSRHEPLPIPAYMRELESIEEIFDIDMETGEITSEMKIEVLPEQYHWKIRLEEFRKIKEMDGVSPKVIGFKLNKYVKNLEAQRGVTIEMLNQPIPKSIKDAIQYAQTKQLSIRVGK